MSPLRPTSESVKISSSGRNITVKQFGCVDYLPVVQAMKRFAIEREQSEPDQIWLLQHPPVYTLGTSCVQESLTPTEIPLVQADRGGQITYHGPGQVVMYPLLRIKDYGLGIKGFVGKLEQSVIDLLRAHGLNGERRENAPGVYVDGAKIAALGLRISRGTSYHGLSLNVDMDLAPFSNIDPCGLAGLQVTQMQNLLDEVDVAMVQRDLLASFLKLI